jgi:DNA-binding winged helix-turn-helix (wHTH) protein/tetratricopeptide (TPR) repeat protein
MEEGASGVLLSAIDLADCADFKLGEAEISPSTRILRGPGGKTSVEPRVMQVLLALWDAQGRVVSREALFRRCWGNVIVGEDSLNRIIAEARRAAKSIAPGSFVIETIPRTGYRLVTRGVGSTARPFRTLQSPIAPASEGASSRSRRWVLCAGAAGATALALSGAGWWLSPPDPLDARVAALIGQSQQAIRTNLPDSDAQGVGFLEEAVTLQPDNSLAWGNLAFARAIIAEHAPPDSTAAAVGGVQEAARRALALDERQPDALAALAILPPYYGSWFAAEQRMRSVLAVEPEHLPTRDHLDFMYAAVGRGREGSIDRIEIAGREPLHAGYQFKLVYANWILGRIGEADRAADRALQLWPKHPGVWFSRLWTLAFTGRAERALAHVEDGAARPDLPPAMIEALRASMTALATRRPRDVDKAADALLGLVANGPSHSVNAVLILNGLGEIDRAFRVAEAYLLERGPLMASVRWRAGQVSINDQRRRKTNMLFVPVSTTMQADPRFLRLTQEIGLADYWSRVGVVPDFLR